MACLLSSIFLKELKKKRRKIFEFIGVSCQDSSGRLPEKKSEALVLQSTYSVAHKESYTTITTNKSFAFKCQNFYKQHLDFIFPSRNFGLTSASH
jgi:hypothetical protein